jgi:hypothetical protein
MVRISKLLILSCDDDTLILHANSGRGSPQCRNNYMLFIFLLIRLFSLRMQFAFNNAMLIVEQ